MSPEEVRVRRLRRQLGRQIVRENDTEGTPESPLSEAEAKALVLAVMDGRPNVSDEELREVMRQFAEAKAGWYALRAALSGYVAISLEDGELRFQLGEAGRDCPRPPFCPVPGVPPALGEG